MVNRIIDISMIGSFPSLSLSNDVTNINSFALVLCQNSARFMGVRSLQERGGVEFFK